MLKSKKLLSFLTCIAMICSLVAVFVSAEPSSDKSDAEIFATYTGKSIAELQQIEKEHGDLQKYFGLHLDKNVIDGCNSGGESTNKMSKDDWKKMKDNTLKGDIVVTKDQSTLGVNHGHAGIVYKKGERSVEALGYGLKSTDRDLKKWKDYKTMRSYYTTDYGTTVRDAASDYAYDKLRDKEYALLPDKDDKDELNCATLVWQAYDSQDVELDSTKGGSVTPECLVKDTDLSLRKGVNWSTKDHEW